MTRSEILNDISETLGIVPQFLETLPDDTLEFEWGAMKRMCFSETAIPNKFKNLIGLAVSAAIRCRYCTIYHTEGARMSGATDDEIQDALLVAKDVSGWSTYFSGSQYDFELFKSELQQIAKHLSKKPEVERVAVSVGGY